MKGCAYRTYQLAMTQTDVKDLHNTIKLMLTSGTNHPIILYDNEFTIELILSEKDKEKTIMTVSEKIITLNITLSEVSKMLSGLYNRFENHNPNRVIMYQCTQDNSILLEIFPLLQSNSSF